TSRLTSKGGDTVLIKGANAMANSTATFAGGDNYVYIDAQTSGLAASKLTTGGGSDTVTIIAPGSALENSMLDTGAGDDVIRIFGKIKGNYTDSKNKTVDSVNAGAGNDEITVVMMEGLIQNNAVINGGTGQDTLRITGVYDDETISLNTIFNGAGAVKGVEELHLAGAWALTLDADTLARFTPDKMTSGPFKNKSILRVDGHDGGEVLFNDSENWQSDGEMYRIDGETWWLFTSAAGDNVLISTALTTPDDTLPVLPRANDMFPVSVDHEYDFANAATTLALAAQGDDNVLGFTAMRFGAGNDVLSLTNGHGIQESALDFGNGNNKLTFAGEGFGIGLDYSRLLFGTGNDTLEIRGAALGAVSSLIDLGAGANRVFIDSDEVNATTLSAGAGADSIVITGTLVDKSAIDAGDGKNTVNIGEVDASWLFTGKDADQVTLGRALNGTNVQLGEGNDTLFLTETRTSGSTLNAGAGNADALDLTRQTDPVVTLDEVVNASTLAGFEIINLADKSAGGLVLAETDLARFSDIDLPSKICNSAKGLDGKKDAALIDALSEGALRIDGDTGTNADTVWLQGSTWAKVGTVTGYTVWCSRADINDPGAELVLIKNGVTVNANVETPDVTAAFAMANVDEYGLLVPFTFTDSRWLTADQYSETITLNGGDSTLTAGGTPYATLARTELSTTLTASADGEYDFVHDVNMELWQSAAGLSGAELTWTGTYSDDATGGGRAELDFTATHTHTMQLAKDLSIYAAKSAGGGSKFAITGSTGNDQVDIFGDVLAKSTFKLGEGANTLRIYGNAAGTTASAGTTVSAGAGDDFLQIVGGATNADINLGAGQNTVNLGGMTGGKLTTGAGNDRIETNGTLQKTVVSMGEGENYLIANGINGGKITATSGDDSLYCNATVTDAIIDLGAGENAIEFLNINGGKISTTSGDDSLYSGGLITDAVIDLGAGENYIEAHEISGGKITTGADGDVLLCDALTSVTVALGAGENEIRIYSMNGGKITTTAGDDIFIAGSALTDATVDLGSGGNYAILKAMAGGKFLTDSGADEIFLQGAMTAAASIASGAGDDAFFVNDAFSMADKSVINAGAGTDTLTLTGNNTEYDLGSLFADAASKINSLEVIQLGEAGQAVNLFLSAEDLAHFSPDAITDAASGLKGQSILRIDGEGTDSVGFIGTGWTPGNTYTVDGTEYILWTDGSSKVLLEKGVSRFIRPFRMAEPFAMENDMDLDDALVLGLDGFTGGELAALSGLGAASALVLDLGLAANGEAGTTADVLELTAESLGALREAFGEVTGEDRMIVVRGGENDTCTADTTGYVPCTGDTATLSAEFQSGYEVYQHETDQTLLLIQMGLAG
ncbi:hypothetical protein LJC26_04800, partial [Desulfovibrio sp. OttesenSCG-928-O18]|nr:hypothetical protein [Desulfovibrio sp. OttesenSCG-928-O18]